MACFDLKMITHVLISNKSILKYLFCKHVVYFDQQMAWEAHACRSKYTTQKILFPISWVPNQWSLSWTCSFLQTYVMCVRYFLYDTVKKQHNLPKIMFIARSSSPNLDLILVDYRHIVLLISIHISTSWKQPNNFHNKLDFDKWSRFSQLESLELPK